MMGRFIVALFIVGFVSLVESLALRSARAAVMGNVENTVNTTKIKNHPALPNPLTFKHAMSLVNESNPDSNLVNVQRQISEKKSALVQSSQGFYFTLDGQVSLSESVTKVNSYGRQDHNVQFSVQKNLYDFGRSRNAVLAQNLSTESINLQLKKIPGLRRLSIMSAYFNVVLSDLTYARDNEAMAIAYIQYDRSKERQSLGQLSELAVVEADASYQASRHARYQSEVNQRLSRARLAIELDRPEDLPSQVTIPNLKNYSGKIKSLEFLQDAAIQNNLDLKIMKRRLVTLNYQIQSIKAERLPSFSVRLETGWYERKIASNDQWRSSLLFELPIYQGGVIADKVDIKRLEKQRLNIDIYQQEIALKQKILEYWLALEYLTVELGAAITGYDYFEYALDRARALYEMEVKSDLGNAMVELTAASLKRSRVEFTIALHWQNLAELSQLTLKDMRQ